MSTYKYYLPILLIAGTTTSCRQQGSSSSGRDSTVDTIVKTDLVKTDTAIATTAPEGAVAGEHLIVPGASVGQTKINENADAVNKRMGKADDGDSAMGKSLSTWYAGHDTSGYQTQIFFSRNMGNDETSRVKQIRITSPEFQTAHGIHVGSPLKSLFAGFRLSKVATYTYNGATYGIYDDKKAGIAFEISDKDICTGIIVHEPETKVAGTYAPFHTNIKMLE